MFTCVWQDCLLLRQARKDKRGLTMAVPKQKKGRGATHTRRSANSKLATPARSECPRCGAPKLPHHVCPSCGYYKDREVVVVE